MPKYNTIYNIPAKVFFDILNTQNYQLLKPKPKEKELKEVFFSIYDEYFIKCENIEAVNYLKTTTTLAFEEFKLKVLKDLIVTYTLNATTKKMRLDLIKGLKKAYGIEIDNDKNFIEEIDRVIRIEIGVLENEISLLKLDLPVNEEENEIKEINYNFTKELAYISTVLPNNSLLKENMMLSTFIELKKIAIEIIESKNKNNG